MNLDYLKRYKKVIINLRGRTENTIHPILSGDYKNIIKKCKKHGIKISFINRKNTSVIKDIKSQNIFFFFKRILYKYITLFLPTMDIVNGKKNQLIITDNQFLLTKSDYIIFTSWIHNLVGYNSKGLYNPYMKYLIRYFISKKNLKYLVVATNTGLASIKNYIGLRFYEKYKEKIIVEIPKITIDSVYLKKLIEIRKNNIGNEKRKTFLFIGKDFVRKGGIETIMAINELMTEGKIDKNTHKFTFITRKENIPSFILNIYKELIKCKLLEHFEPSFKLKDIYEKFYTNNGTFLLPTRGDPFGMSFLEAKIFGMNVITTDQGPIKEILGKDNVEYIKIKNKNYNWLRNDLKPKFSHSKLINKNYNTFIDIKKLKNAII